MSWLWGNKLIESMGLNQPVQKITTGTKEQILWEIPPQDVDLKKPISDMFKSILAHGEVGDHSDPNYNMTKDVGTYNLRLGAGVDSRIELDTVSSFFSTTRGKTYTTPRGLITDTGNEYGLYIAVSPPSNLEPVKLWLSVNIIHATLTTTNIVTLTLLSNKDEKHGGGIAGEADALTYDSTTDTFSQGNIRILFL